MERSVILEHLALAEHHLRSGEERIARQKMLIKALRIRGQRVADAEDLLRHFEKSQQLQARARNCLRAELGRV